MTTTRVGPARRVALSAVIVMGGFVASKAIGVVRQSIIARTFGASAFLDAYYAAFRLPDLLLTLIAGGAIATTFIPVFADHLTRGDTDRAWRLASAVLNLLLATVGIVSLLAAVAAPWLVRQFVAPGFEPGMQQLTTELLRIVLVSTVIFAASSLMMSVLQAHQHFLFPALADFFYDVGIIAGAILLVPRLGIRGLALGVVGGAALHLLIQVPALLHYRPRYVLTFRTGDPDLLRLGKLMGPRILILGMFQLVFLVTTNIASGLEEGSISAFNMGWTVMQMPEVIFAMAIATAAFPAMSAQAAEADHRSLQGTVSSALRAILFLTLPSAVALALLGHAYVAVLFRSSIFDERAADMVYKATLAFTAGLLGHSVLELAARIFYAQKNTVTPFWIALGATVCNIGICLVLAPLLGQAGLALANSVAVTFQSAILLWLGWRKVRFPWRPVWSLGLRAIFASGLMAVSIWAIARWSVGQGNLWVTLVGSAVGSAVYLGTMALTSREETRALMRALLRLGA